MAEEEKEATPEPVAEDGAAPAVGGSSHSGHGTKRLHSAHSGMESSVFRFKNLNFTVGSAEKQKHLLTDVTETVKWGRVLASEYNMLCYSRRSTLGSSHPLACLLHSHGA